MWLHSLFDLVIELTWCDKILFMVTHDVDQIIAMRLMHLLSILQLWPLYHCRQLVFNKRQNNASDCIHIVTKLAEVDVHVLGGY